MKEVLIPWFLNVQVQEWYTKMNKETASTDKPQWPSQNQLFNLKLCRFQVCSISLRELFVQGI